MTVILILKDGQTQRYENATYSSNDGHCVTTETGFEVRVPFSFADVAFEDVPTEDVPAEETATEDITTTKQAKS